MKELSDWELLQQEFTKNFPDEAAKKECSDCIHSTWVRIRNTGNENTFVPYCGELKFALNTLVEADTCDSFTLKDNR
jgi:hypothetical protein